MEHEVQLAEKEVKVEVACHNLQKKYRSNDISRFA